MRTVALLLALTLLPFAVFGSDKKDEVLVTFSGLLKSLNKKQIVIEPEPDNQMTFVRSKRTRFMKGGNQIDSSAVLPGSVVSIQAFEKLNRELEAVIVTVTDAAPQSPSK
jgi:exosortase/archaeosortase